MACPLH
jgi:anti-anti-sigma factor